MTNSAEIMCRTSKGEVLPLSIGAYPGGEPMVKWPGQDRIEAVLLRPASLLSFMTAMFWVDAMADRGLPVPELILPYVPGARQDRLNDSGDYLFTAMSVAKEINLRNFPLVTVVDPHSDVAPALIERCKVIHAADVINPPAGKYSAVISPDGGAEKRAGAVARKLGVPLIHAWKTRDVATGEIRGFGVGRLEPLDGLALVVDDICDGGGTFLGLADVLDVRSIRAHLYVTHGIFSRGTEELKRRYQGHLYCTDSVLGPWLRPEAIGSPLDVIVIDVCKRLIEGGTV